MTQTEKTINYYNQNAASFASGTQDADMEELRRKFADKLRAESFILDFGCGSGRDTKHFLESGFHVTAVDGSEEMCKYASEYTGIPVRKMMFQELNEQDKYDGIWACSSILHLSKKELRPVLVKMIDALRCDGLIYTSFKYGDFEGERNGRYFTDFSMETFTEFLEEIDNIKIEDWWISGDVRPGRGEEKWLNLLLRKI